MLERERNLDTSDISKVQDLFWDFHFLRKSGSQGVDPFDPLTMKAHLELSGKTISTWEYKLILEMDLIFRSISLEKRGS